MRFSIYTTEPLAKEVVVNWLSENFQGSYEVTSSAEVVEVSTQYSVPLSLAKFAAETGLRPVSSGSSGVVAFNTPPTPDEYAGLVESVIREKVVAYNYTSIESACSYAGSTVPKFKVEGTAFMRWRDLLWHAVDSVGESGVSLDDLAAGLPTFESVLAEVQAELSAA